MEFWLLPIVCGFSGGVGAFLGMKLLNFLDRRRESRRKRTSHLCHHINGAHRCMCRTRRDHSSAHHTMMIELYDQAKEEQ